MHAFLYEIKDYVFQFILLMLVGYVSEDRTPLSKEVN